MTILRGQPIPIDPPSDTESRAQYGQRLVLHILQTGETAAICDGDLELALSQSTIFYVRGVDAVVVTAIQQTRALICLVLAARAKDAVPVHSTVQPPAVEPSTPNEGPMARLKDRPLVRPPSGSLATIEF